MAQKATNLMTVAEMIETTFGASDTNTVHFKLLRTTLLLLARQLRLLDRQIIVETDTQIKSAKTFTRIAEIKFDDKKNKAEHTKSEPLSERDSEIRPPYNKLSMRTLSHTHDLGEDTTPQNSNVSIKSETTLRVQKYHKLLEKLEEQREKVLRVINQRKNSKSEALTPASPMHSLRSSERNLQKLFVVENYDTEDTLERRNYGIITQTQFTELQKKVENLETRLGMLDNEKFGALDFPENVKLMQELRQGASLTEAMSALQISARMEAAEKAISTLSELVDELGVSDPSQCPKDKFGGTTIKTIKDNAFANYITKDNLQTIIEQEKDEIFGRINSHVARTLNALEGNIVQKLEDKLNEALTLRESFNEMQKKLDQCSRHLSSLDIALSSQVCNIQEQMTYVKLELDAGLQNMTETLANKGIDQELISDLQNHLDSLQSDVEREIEMQVTSKMFQGKLATEIDTLNKEIELLLETKCDREEVLDALRDKAGVEQLNGMISQDQHLASIAAMSKMVNNTQSMFRAQEIMWQKVIDDLQNNIDQKAEIHDVMILREDIQKHLNDLKHKIESILASLGEPLAASISRKIYRDSKCLSCSNPAHIAPPDPAVPFLPPLRPPGAGEVSSFQEKYLGQGDQAGRCIAGLPVRVNHTRNERSELCTRYCGGSYTVQRDAGASFRKTSNLRVQGKPLLRPEINSIQMDGMVYKLEDTGVLETPCIPCNRPSVDGSVERKEDPRLEYSRFELKHSPEGRCECTETAALPPVRNVSFDPSVPPMDQMSALVPSGSMCMIMDD